MPPMNICPGFANWTNHCFTPVTEKAKLRLLREIASAEALKTTIIGTLKAQDLATATSPMANLPGHDNQFEENESWGPKTTAVPEDLECCSLWSRQLIRTY
ncbi:uncharacterized protein LACBIDRAFT_329793 [Laccaria bicolor S238N-H82]|uniref:Predicted protein n=1 Tax=Laccaria bicolor (strain S238N-H82 / ATCC MYA-4686) TaxID=486041 RepID=B0DJ92_LACBS|nr:uncharacterized protein LACBIDRAFT_329793 [Laccaria bicolor S238N-H82]EDR05482.1 predicted protein [Laccaria bicolor S238N-H82]|eukprot:XP_001884040.1 predicted protein [Laccaria bicolor S238N-H82]